MYGDIIELAENALFVEGLEPTTILKEPDIASTVLYKSGNTLYIMDTGATLFFRNRIREAAERLRPFDNLTLLNSHGHPDHTPNNAVINEIAAKNKEHYISEVGIPFMDYSKRTRSDFNIVGKYYHIEDGPGFPISILTRPFKLLRLISPGLVEYRLTNFITKRVMSKFVPLEPSKETAVPFEKRKSVSLPIRGLKLKGWNFNNDVFVIESRGHTPDSVSFYLPKVKLLFLSDETTDYFNLWADTSSKRILEILNNALAMYQNGDVDIVIGGHQQAVFKGSMIPDLITRLIENHNIFRRELTGIIEKHPEGITIKRIYNELRKRRSIPAIDSYFRFEFPKMPPMLKTNITYALLEDGCVAEGPEGRKRFKSTI